MNSYLVGGAVRDSLLGIPVKDRDWVVVGSSPDAMLAAGYKSVGKDFPVFLHPQTHEEFALARVERKTAPGYHGFTFRTDSSVTLEEDLSRRDLTINAIAQTNKGELIDPYNGHADLKNRLLRHVSDAFIEDPVRILRVAKFMARLSNRGFTVAPETIELMRTMMLNGEADNLVAERVWQEMGSGLRTHTPAAFYETLRQCDALAVVLPEVDALFGVPQPEKWHPEIDSGIHTMMVLEQSAKVSEETDVRFAALCHDLGKATTPADILPSHHGHEKRGAEISELFCQRLRIPKKIRELAVMTARYHTHCHRVHDLNASTLAKLLKGLDVTRRRDRFEKYLLVCAADARGRLGYEKTNYPQADYLREAADWYCKPDTASIASQLEDKSQIANAITEARVKSIKQWLKAQSNN